MSGGIHIRMRRGTLSTFAGEAGSHRIGEPLFDVERGAIGIRSPEAARWYPSINESGHMVLQNNQMLMGEDGVSSNTLAISFSTPGEIQIIEVGTNTIVARFSTTGVVLNNVSSGGVGATFGWRNYLFNNALQVPFDANNSSVVYPLLGNKSVAPGFRQWVQNGTPGSLATTLMSMTDSNMPGVKNFLRVTAAGNVINGGIRTHFYNPRMSVGGRQMCFSYYVRSTTAGSTFTHRVTQSSGLSAQKTNSIVTANVWQRVFVPFVAELNPSPGYIAFDMIHAPSNDTYDITGAQLEIGSSPTELELRPYDLEVELAERTYVCQTIKLVAGTPYNWVFRSKMSGVPSIKVLTTAPATVPTISNITADGCVIDAPLATGTMYVAKVVAEYNVSTSETA